MLVKRAETHRLFAKLKAEIILLLFTLLFIYLFIYLFVYFDDRIQLTSAPL